MIKDLFKKHKKNTIVLLISSILNDDKLYRII